MAVDMPDGAERAARMDAIHYAFGAIDAMSVDERGTLDTLDASNFALLCGAFPKLPGLTPPLRWAWLAYVEARRDGVSKLSPTELAQRAARVAARP